MGGEELAQTAVEEPRAQGAERVVGLGQVGLARLDVGTRGGQRRARRLDHAAYLGVDLEQAAEIGTESDAQPVEGNIGRYRESRSRGRPAPSARGRRDRR